MVELPDLQIVNHINLLLVKINNPYAIEKI